MITHQKFAAALSDGRLSVEIKSKNGGEEEEVVPQFVHRRDVAHHLLGERPSLPLRREPSCADLRRVYHSSIGRVCETSQPLGGSPCLRWVNRVVSSARR